MPSGLGWAGAGTSVGGGARRGGGRRGRATWTRCRWWPRGRQVVVAGRGRRGCRGVCRTRRVGGGAALHPHRRDVGVLPARDAPTARRGDVPGPRPRARRPSTSWKASSTSSSAVGGRGWGRAGDSQVSSAVDGATGEGVEVDGEQQPGAAPSLRRRRRGRRVWEGRRLAVRPLAVRAPPCCAGRGATWAEIRRRLCRFAPAGSRRLRRR